MAAGLIDVTYKQRRVRLSVKIYTLYICEYEKRIIFHVLNSYTTLENSPFLHYSSAGQNMNGMFEWLLLA